MRDSIPEGCPFCRITGRNPVIESQLSFVIFDAYPVNPGHVLIIPRRHVSDFFDLGEEETVDLIRLLWMAKKHLLQQHHPDGFNVGINVGTVAGQTIDHVHIHLIPRYTDDVEDPTGGVRGVIPWKSKY